MAFKMKNPEVGKTAKAAGSPHKFGIAGEMKGIDSASRGTKGMDTKSPMKAKRKFKVNVRDEDFVGKSRTGEKGKTSVDDLIADERAAQEGFRRTGAMTEKEIFKRTQKLKKENRNLAPGTGYDAKNLRAAGENVRVKVKGRKDKSTGKGSNQIVTSADSETARKGKELKDIKKVVMKKGSGKHKKKTKVKYDRHGNVKKEVTYVGRLGLRKADTGSGKGKRGAGVRVGTRSGKDLKGAAAAERIVERKTQANIKGRARRESGDKKA
jgi:hypothetical protein|tara:strand:- start:857 stop:1657 length:801 start_codon:yes stop_codon:yes gene_type:complete